MIFSDLIWKLERNELNIASTFSGCLIQIINFRGSNVNFSNITQPIVLLRYFSFPNQPLVYPIEMSYAKPNDTLMGLQNLNLAVFEAKNMNNKTLFPRNVNTEYIQSTLNVNKSFRLSIKNTNCEANIYLHPPSQTNNPSLYHEDINLGLMIKDPFWLNYDLNYDLEEKWRYGYMNSIPKYSLLICDQTNNSVCSSDKEQTTWISTVLYLPFLNRVSETVLVLKVLPNKESLYILCIYCDPCEPFKLNLVSRKRNPISKTSLSKNIADTTVRWVDMVFTNYIWQYRFLQRKSQKTKRAILRYITYLKLEEFVSINYLADVHIISHLFPDNASMFIGRNYHPKSNKWKVFEIRLCPNSNGVKYHPKLRPAILRISKKYLGALQDFTLVFRRDQLRFVSCHKEQLHWIVQLKELVTVFDILTWTFLLLTFIALAILLNCVQTAQKPLNIIFNLYATFVEQSSGLFENLTLRKNLTFYVCFSFIPMTFFYIENLYKGDNITRLTLDPPMLRFDTFDSLVTHHFKIYVRRMRLSGFAMRKTNFHKGTAYFQENRHEAFPDISELLHFTLLHWRIQDWRRLNDLKSLVSERTWFYLSNSEMFPAWNLSDGQLGYAETAPKILKLHMDACNRSAIISSDAFAIPVYTTLKLKTKQVFYGKDIIYETFHAYRYHGYLPTKVLLKSKYYFQTGILDWWQKYFKWCLEMKTAFGAEILKLNGSSSSLWSSQNSNSSAAYVISFIPLVGLLLSLLSFILFDSYLIVHSLLFAKVLLAYCMKAYQSCKQNLKSVRHQLLSLINRSEFQMHQYQSRQT